MLWYQLTKLSKSSDKSKFPRRCSTRFFQLCGIGGCGSGKKCYICTKIFSDMEIRIIRHRLAALAGALCLGGAAAFPQQTRLLTGDKSNEYGVVYSLPVTELVVDATCRVTTRVPGPFRQYATRYLGTEATVSEPSSSSPVWICSRAVWPGNRSIFSR